MRLNFAYVEFCLWVLDVSNPVCKIKFIIRLKDDPTTRQNCVDP